MALATLGAFFLAIWTKSGDYVEGIAVMLFYQIGELFQSYAVGKSRRNISALMDIRPDYANIETDGKLEQVDPGRGRRRQRDRCAARRERCRSTALSSRARPASTPARSPARACRAT